MSQSDDVRWLLQLVEFQTRQPLDVNSINSLGVPTLARHMYSARKAARILGGLLDGFNSQIESLERAQSYAQRRAHNDAQPCGRLPNETLAEIFCALLPDADEPVMVPQGSQRTQFIKFREAARGVCSRWSTVVRDTPQCWSVINHRITGNNYSSDYTKLALQRSKHVDLNVGIDCKEGVAVTGALVEHLAQILGPHASRCVRLVVMNISPHHFDTLFSAGRFENLKHIAIVPVGEESPISVNIQPTSLRSFLIRSSLRFPRIGTFVFPSLSTIHLTHLQIRITSNVHATLAAIAQSPALEHLVLFLGLFPSNTAAMQLSFNRLKSFIPTMVADRLLPIDAPTLEMLDLTFPYLEEQDDRILDWIADPRAYPRLSKLAISPFPGITEDVAHFVNAAPALRSLVLKRLHCNGDIFAEFLDMLYPLSPTRPSVRESDILLQLILIPRSGGFELSAPLLDALNRLLSRQPCVRLELLVPPGNVASTRQLLRHERVSITDEKRSKVDLLGIWPKGSL